MPWHSPVLGQCTNQAYTTFNPNNCLHLSHTSGLDKHWMRMIHLSVGKSARTGYGASFSRFLEWRDSQLHLLTDSDWAELHWADVRWFFAYMTHLFVENKSVKSALEFSAAFSLKRIQLLQGPRISDSEYKSVLKQVLQSFNKKYQLAAIPLPNSRALQKLLSRRFVYLGLNGLCLWCYLTACGLGLRAREIFMLQKEYFDFENNLLVWPKHVQIKGGPIRKLFPHQLAIARYFCKYNKNPFLQLNQTALNKFLMKHLQCTLRSARHVGAFVILEETKSVGCVAQGLGHSSIACSIYYIDPWNLHVPYTVLASQLIQVLKGQCWTFWREHLWAELFASLDAFSIFPVFCLSLKSTFQYYTDCINSQSVCMC